MHILFLTDNFPPEVNAPASRTFEHCREWVKAGHQVTVVTCAPNFPKGRVFEGYRNRLVGRETMDGIQVIRVWSYITANQGFLRRTLDYVSFMLMAVPASMGVRQPDVVVATSPQFFTACAGYVVGLFRRIPYVFELRDLWPESIRALDVLKPSPVLDALERLELFLYRKAALVISVTHAFKDNLQRRGIDPGKIHVVTNGADLSRFQPRSRNEALAKRLALDQKFVAGYVGTHGMAHALETLLKAAQLLKDAGRDDIRILLLGDGASKQSLRERAKIMELTNVIFVDSVPKREVVEYWSLLDASIIHLRKTDLFKTVIPSKMFESMAMGIPILHGVEGESAAIVVETQAGLVFEPENAEALRDRLVELSEDAALRATLAANGVAGSRRFDRSSLAEAMLGHIEDQLSGHGSHRVVRKTQIIQSREKSA
jgi:glycosyltransferase involved in cell wall biosynthesis